MHRDHTPGSGATASKNRPAARLFTSETCRAHRHHIGGKPPFHLVAHRGERVAKLALHRHEASRSVDTRNLAVAARPTHADERHFEVSVMVRARFGSTISATTANTPARSSASASSSNCSPRPA